MNKANVALIAVVLAMTLSCQKIDRTKPPETKDLPAFKLPSLYETELANGLRVVLVEDKRFPLVTLRLTFEAGSKYDPKDLPGLAEAAASLLTEGTGDRPSKQIAEELADIGGSIRAAAGPDGFTIQGNVLSENLPKFFDLLADVTMHASFPQDEVQLYKKRRTQELLAERSEAAFWADEKIASVVFGPHPYARLNPTPESIARLDRGLLASFHGSRLVPNNAVLILLGAIPPRMETLELIRSRLGPWQKKDAEPSPAPEFPGSVRKIVLVDRPGSVQADIRMGHIAVDRSHEDYFPLLVANTILGGGASSRMFMNIREKQGFAYDAHSRLQPRKNGGLFAAVTQVRNEVLEPALKSMEEEMKRLVDEPVPSGELADVKNYLSGNFVMGLETQGGLATQLSTVKLMGLPDTYLETYTARIRAVQPAQIQAVAAKYFSPQTASIVVVGDASKIRSTLEKFGGVTVEKAQ